MQLDIRNTDFRTLLTLHKQEQEKLKEKLLMGESWNNLKPICRNITELAKAIQKSYSYIFPNRIFSGNPAEFPQTDELPNKPVE